jgi:hypothetical protein
MMDVILSGAKNLLYESQMLRLAAQHDNSSNNRRRSTNYDIITYNVISQELFWGILPAFAESRPLGVDECEKGNPP